MPVPAKPKNSDFFVFSGILGLFGCVAGVGTDIAGVIISPQYGFVHDTISALAGGPFDWIQDIGLAWFSIGSFAVGIGLYRWKLGGIGWRIGSILLAVLAAAILVLTVHEQYSKLIPYGLVIHSSLVGTIGIVFALVSLCTAKGLKRVYQRSMYFGLSTAVLWIVAAPILTVVPDSWEGAYERSVALVMVLWLAVVSFLLIRSAFRAVETS